MVRSATATLLLLLLVAGCRTSIECANRTIERTALDTEKIRWPLLPAESVSNAVQLSDLSPKTVRALQELTTFEQWQTVFRVGVAQAEPGGRAFAPMLGTYTLGSNFLRFTPRFPLQTGMSYRAEFNSPVPSEIPSIVSDYDAPARKLERRTVVAEIYPTASELPENLLKFYLHFSAPMSRGDVYQHIKLIGPTGQAVDLPFLELGEELWDPQLKRLTLLIDPGRIKREVKPLEEIGPVFEAGRRYSLIIDNAWLDGEGTPLRRRHVKRFIVAPPDRQPIDPHRWKMGVPRQGTRAALTVKFGEALDHALATRLIHVENAQHERLPGTASLSHRETQWHFVPDAPWPKETFYISAEQILEDIAGNSVGRPFEVDVTEPAPVGKPVRLPVHVR